MSAIALTLDLPALPLTAASSRAEPAHAASSMDDLASDLVELLPRVLDGDQAAARQLVEALHPQVIRIIRAHLPRRSSEEDLAQEVFLKLFTRIGQYRGQVPLSHWVSRIAVTTCIDALRAQRRRPEWRLADFSPDEQAAIENATSEDASHSPEAGEDARELVARLLERLDPKDRLVLSLLDLERRTVAEIRQLTGWNESLIKVRAFRARAKLRKLFLSLEPAAAR